MPSRISIIIKNWDKYNPRKDIKNPSWFAFSNRMIEDPEFYDLTHSEFKAWIYCLSRASQKASNVVEIDFRHAERICNIDQKDFEQMLKKLENCISVRTRTGARTDAYADVQIPVHDKQTDRHNKQDKQTEGVEEKEPPLNNFYIPEEVSATYQSLMCYPAWVIEHVAKEAWPIYTADSRKGKEWPRFLSHYIRNEKTNIRTLIEEKASRQRLIEKYEGSEYEF